MFGKLFAPLAMKVAGGIIAALVLALAVQTWRISSANGKLDEARKELAQAELKHSITLQSLDALAADLKAMVKDGEARSERVEELAVKAKRESNALRTDADKVRAAVVEVCETPDVILRSGL